ncbi:MAG: flagellar export chaperone FliS [bacterium]
MSALLAKQGTDAYKQVHRVSGVEAADPHKLVDMLMGGALENIASAKGHMQRNEIAEKGQCISKSISIIEGLRGSLNHEQGGEVSGNLDALYEYMESRLLKANLQNDTEALDEVISLMIEIRGAWNQIPDEIRKSFKANRP